MGGRAGKQLVGQVVGRQSVAESVRQVGDGSESLREQKKKESIAIIIMVTAPTSLQNASSVERACGGARRVTID